MSGRSRYLDMVRGQRRQGPAWHFNAKDGMILLAVAGITGSAAYWWSVQTTLTEHTLVAAAFTVLLTLAPPSLTSFLIPWSPAGMLIQKVNVRTWGYAVVIACSLFFLYYSAEIQYRWWAAQQVVADTQLVLQQVVIGIIGFIVIPALLWTPVTSEELVEQVRQAHLVKRYQLQTEADIAILRATLLRAQEKALIGFCNLTVQEQEDLAGVMRGLLKNIDNELRQVGESVDALAVSTRPFGTLDDNEDIAGYLGYVADALKENALLPRRARRPDIVPDDLDPLGVPNRPRVNG